MMAKAKKKEEEVVVDEISKALAEHGLKGLVQLASEINTKLETVSTGFPGVDLALCEPNPGLARGIDAEVFSDMGSAGKTTLAIMILAHWQRLGYKTLFVDIENAPGLEAFMNSLGVITDPALCPPGVHAVRIVRGKIDEKSGKAVPLTLQQVMNIVEICAKEIFDLIVVDSVDAMVDKNEMEKTSDDNSQVGGISKKMSEFMRKTVVKRATVIWLNQTRDAVGQYSPTGSTPRKTSGGRAMLFYADLRIKLDVVGRLQDGKDGDIYGFITKATVIKNKTWNKGMWKTFELKNVFGLGFSPIWDYFEQGLKLKAIVQSGAWYELPNVLRVQGKRNLFNALCTNENGSFDALKKMIDGEDVDEDDLPPEASRVIEAELENVV